MLGLRHWVATVPEDEDGEAGCRGTALAAAGEGGEEGRLPTSHSFFGTSSHLRWFFS